MKIALRSLLTAAVVTTLAACGSKDSSPKAEPSASTQAAASATASAATASAAATSAATASAAPAKAPAPAKEASIESPKRLPDAVATTRVPDDWTRMADPNKGFGFWLPANAGDGAAETQNGVDLFIAQVPEPHVITVLCLAFKDRAQSKKDLLQAAQEALAAFGETEIQVEKTDTLSKDYDLSVITSVAAEDKSQGKAKVLVATDLTDNYILIVHSPAEKFAANEQTMDIIWGSFEMFSGGGQGREVKVSYKQPRPSSGCNTDADCPGGHCVVMRCPGCNRCEREQAARDGDPCSLDGRPGTVMINADGMVKCMTDD